MAKKTEKWREFEKLVAAIYARATPQATVQHNYFIAGRSGRRRQIDVSIEARQGLHSYFTVVECKRYARRVGIRDVEAFITKIQDVCAAKGVMVSTTGFDDGARAQAQQHNVTLFSYREAVATDWQKVAAASVWVTFTTEDFVPEYMIAELLDGEVAVVAPHELLYSRDKEASLTGLEMAASMIQEHPFLANTYAAASQRAPGPMWIKGHINTTVGPLYLQRDGNPRQVENITIQGDMLVRAYSVNPIFGSGHIMEDALTGHQPYTEIHSAPFNMHAVIRSQEGRIVTLEEHRSSQSQRVFIPPEAAAKEVQFRITITAPSAEAQG